MNKAEALAGIRERMAPVVPGQKYSVRRFEPRDAWGVARLFLEVYGEDYPIEDAYIPERIVAVHAEGTQRTVVAEAADGTILGQAAFFQSSPPNPAMFEYGQILVLREYRNAMLAGRLHQFATNEMAGRDGVDVMFGEAVCTHLVTQKFSRSMRYDGCAMELGLLGEETHAHEGAVGRVSCLLMTRVDADRRQPRYVPECWSGLLDLALKDFARLERDLAPSGPELPDSGQSRLEDRHFGFAGVTRVNAFSVGADFAERLAAIMAEAEARGDAVVQFWLALGSPHCGGAAQALRRAGFFCGGAVPCWFAPGGGGDALLAQRFLKPVNLARINLFNEDAEALCAAVLADMERAGREFGAPVGTLPAPDPAGERA